MKLLSHSFIFTSFLLVIMGAYLAIFLSLPTIAATEGNPNVRIGDTTIFVDVADTPLLRIRHINGRYYLKNNSGVLLVLDNESRYGFLASNTFFSADVVWFDKRKNITHIEYDIEPETFPEIFVPEELSKYMLIVPAGFVKENGIKRGMRATFSDV